MALARCDNDWFAPGAPTVPPVPEVQEVCAADFERIKECRSNPPKPTQAAKEANRLFYQLLANT